MDLLLVTRTNSCSGNDVFLGDSCPQFWAIFTFSFLACTDHLKKENEGR